MRVRSIGCLKPLSIDASAKMKEGRRTTWKCGLSLVGHYLNITAAAAGTLLMAKEFLHIGAGTALAATTRRWQMELNWS